MIVNSKFIFCSRRFGLVLILLIFFSAIIFPILCQNKKLAIIPNINIDGNNDRQLIELLTTIENSNEKLGMIILLGELGIKNDRTKINELIEYIAEQKIPIKIIPGYKDFSSGINNPNVIENQLAEKDFVININGTNIIGFNSVIPFNDRNGIINVETINEIESGISSLPSKITLLFSNSQPDKIINFDRLLNKLKTEKAFYFYPASKEFKVGTNLKNNFSEITFSSLKAAEKSFYYLIELTADSIFINKKSFENCTSQALYSSELSKIDKLNLTDSNVSMDSSVNVLNIIAYQSTSSSGLLISKNRIYNLLENGLVYCLDSTGKEIFITEIFGTLKSGALLYKDLLLIPTLQGDLYSVNSNNGEVIQVVGIGETITNLTLINIDDRTIATVVGTASGNIFCYDAFTFELLWKNNFTEKPILSISRLKDDKIILITSDFSVYCVNPKSGILIWKYIQKGKDNFFYKDFPVSDGNNIYSFSPDGELIGLDILQGKKTWSSNLKTDIYQLFYDLDQELMYHLNSSSELFINSTKDKKTKTKIELKKSEIYSFNLLKFGEDILLGLSDGSLNMINKKNEFKELISAQNVPVVSLGIISDQNIVMKDLNGKIFIIKIDH